MLRSNKIISSKNFQLKMLLILFLFSFSKSWGQTSNLFFSEYIEGSGNNRFLEIYNGTGATVNLSNYVVRLYANGASSATTSFTLSGTLATCSVVTIENSGETIGVTSTFTSGVCAFNGDDAITLETTSGIILDVIGNIGCDPGTNWNGSGNTTLDKTLVRNASVCSGVGDDATSCPFPTIASEWTQFNIDVVSNLGSHAITCASCSGCTAPTTTITPTTQTVCAGAVTTISVSSSAASNTYTWQASANGTSGWASVTSNTPVGTSYSGQGTATLSVTAGSTYYYRCLVTDVTASCTATSGTSTLVVNSAPTITTQTTPSSTLVCAGTATSFSVGATGTNLTYQWQVSTGGAFSNATGGAYTTETTNKLNIGTGQAVGSYTFQCIISNSCGTLTSTPVTLTVASVPAMPVTPSIITTCAPAVISETVVGTPPVGVTWYWETSSTATSTTSPTSVDYTLATTGNVFVRALHSGGCWNNTPTTSSVAVTVIKSPTITTQPSNTLVCQGNSASIKVTMNGGTSTPITYQWQENTGSGFTNISIGSPYTVSVGTYTSTLNIDNTKPIGTYTYQCVISNSCGTVTTSIVTVSITATPANDLCSNSSPIVIDAAPVIGNLNCASPTAGLTYNPSKNDVWYAFTPTCTATHTVTLTFTQTGGIDYDLDLFTTGSCPTSGTAVYVAHGSSTTETITQTLTSGVTYYLRVLDYNTSGGTFSVGVASNCGTPHTVTFDANGGSGSMSNQTSSSATNLTSNTFTNSGCTFVNWNDSANANGTSYANSAVYSFTADVTLYAQWNCTSGGGSSGCPYLVSAVINACAGSCSAEGKNEIVVMNSGNYAIPVNGTNVNLYYSGGTNHYFTNSFAASSGTVVSNLNTLTATSGCTNTPFTFVPSGGTIPANSNFMILNSNSCFNGDFSAYCNSGPIYVIISTDADWEVGGYFGNNNTPRYFRTDFSSVNAGCGLTTYNYNNPSTFSFGSDGASVVFNGTTPSYITGSGSCAPSIAILPIELIDFYATQDGAKNNLVWKVASENSISQYIIEKSDDGVNFTELSRVNTNNIENAYQIYQSEDNSPNSGITYYRLSTLENSNEVNHYKIIDIDRFNKDWKSLLYQSDDELILEFKNAVPKNSKLLLFDLSGKLLSETVLEQSRTKINTVNLATGIYFAKIESPYKIENFKIFIRNDK